MAQRPPTPWLIAYRLFGIRLPEEYRAWVADDVASRMFVTYRVTRTFLWLLAGLGLFVLAASRVGEAPTGRTILLRLVPVLLAISLLASGKTLVRRTLQWQRIDRHGRPVRPRRLAVLTNAEAIVLGVGTLVAFTGASAVFKSNVGDTASCHKPDKALIQRIKAGFKKPGTSLVSPQLVNFAKGQVVATFYLSPGGEKPTFLALTVEKGQIYELNSGVNAKSAPTTFKPLTDQSSFSALRDAVMCLGKAAPR